MTGLHFLAAGVRITLSRDSLDYVVEGPVDRPELARELAWEVSTRLDLVGTSPTLPPGTKTDHPTSKPVDLFKIPMEEHTLPGEVCYEPFSGSGSQHVAGEQTGRLVYGNEISPQFCAAILERLSGMGLACRLEQGMETPAEEMPASEAGAVEVGQSA